MKAIALALFIVGAALAIPTPDDITPETSLSQIQEAAAKDAKKTISTMLESGSDSSACADLADEILNEVRNVVTEKENVLNQMDDGSSCDSQFADTLKSAQDAVSEAQTAKNNADAAFATASAAPVDFGEYSLATLGGLLSGECSMFATDSAYIAARNAEASAKTTAETAAATLSAAQAAVEAEERRQEDAIKICRCHTWDLYKTAYDTANQVSDEDMKAWTKGKHMQCVLAGTEPSDCEVGSPPEVTMRTLAPGVDGSGCDDRWVNEPGCYVRVPNGCPNQPQAFGQDPHDEHYISNDWHHDWWGEAHRNSKDDESACMETRKSEFDSWCSISDTEMRWVPPTGGYVGQQEGPGESDGVYQFDAVGPEKWKLVRRVKAGNSWHPATDQMTGTESYGTYDPDSQSESTYSLKFDDMHCAKYLFATGDMEKWLVAPVSSVIGWYANQYRSIDKSSTSSTPYSAAWYRRHGALEDPWISLTDHGPAIGQGNILYGERSFGSTHASAVLPMHKGANVFCLLE